MEPKDSETSFLDLLLVMAENLKLLVFVPMAAGILAWGAANMMPQSYISQAILALPNMSGSQGGLGSTAGQVGPSGYGGLSMLTPNQAAALMVSPLVLDSIVESFGLAQGRPIDKARASLLNQIKVTVGKDNLLRVDVIAGTPEQAQKLASAVIDVWLRSTIPGEQEREELQQRLIYAKTALSSVRRLLERTATVEGANKLNRPLTWAESGTSIISMYELQARYLNDVVNIPHALTGISRDVIKQPPTLPTEPVASRKGAIAMVTALGVGFLLLCWVFMRQAWLNAAQDPQMSEKQARLRATLGLKN